MYSHCNLSIFWSLVPHGTCLEFRFKSISAWRLPFLAQKEISFNGRVPDLAALGQNNGGGLPHFILPSFENVWRYKWKHLYLRHSSCMIWWLSVFWGCCKAFPGQRSSLSGQETTTTDLIERASVRGEQIRVCFGKFLHMFDPVNSFACT